MIPIIAIIGSRTFNDYELFKQTIKHLTQNIPNFSIVSGGAKGADQLAEKYAKENNIPIKVILPDWATHGREAGFRRNYEIINNATHLIAFQVDNSKGTQHSIDIAIQKELPMRVIHI